MLPPPPQQGPPKARALFDPGGTTLPATCPCLLTAPLVQECLAEIGGLKRRVSELEEEVGEKGVGGVGWSDCAGGGEWE